MNRFPTNDNAFYQALDDRLQSPSGHQCT